METNDVPTDEQRALVRELLSELFHFSHGIKPDMRNAARGEMAVIMMLHHAAEEGEPPLTPSDIAERSHLTSARIANVLRSLEEKGWVAREHASDDRRRVTVTLTEAGDAERARRRLAFEESAAAFVARLGEDDARDAVRILKHCNQLIEEDRKEARAR